MHTSPHSPRMAEVMRPRTRLLWLLAMLASFAAGLFSAEAATVRFALTNFNITTASNQLQIIPTNAPFSSSPWLIIGQPIRLYTTNGIAETNLLAGSYLLGIVGMNYKHPIVFHVPDDAETYDVTTLITNISVSTSNLPYVTRIVAGDGVTLSPTSGRGDVTVNATVGSGTFDYESLSNAPVFLPVNYGADGTGSQDTDDAGAWTLALAAAGGQDGVAIVDGQGKTYHINSTILLTNAFVTLQNFHWVTTNASLCVFSNILGDVMIMRNFSITGPGTNCTDGSIGISLFADAPTDHYILSPQLADGRVQGFDIGIRMQHCDRPQMERVDSLANRSYALFIQSCDTTVFRRCIFGYGKPNNLRTYPTEGLDEWRTNSIAVRILDGVDHQFYECGGGICGQYMKAEGTTTQPSVSILRGAYETFYGDVTNGIFQFTNCSFIKFKTVQIQQLFAPVRPLIQLENCFTASAELDLITAYSPPDVTIDIVGSGLPTLTGASAYARRRSTYAATPEFFYLQSPTTANRYQHNTFTNESGNSFYGGIAVYQGGGTTLKLGTTLNEYGAPAAGTTKSFVIRSPRYANSGTTFGSAVMSGFHNSSQDFLDLGFSSNGALPGPTTMRFGVSPTFGANSVNRVQLTIDALKPVTTESIGLGSPSLVWTNVYSQRFTGGEFFGNGGGLSNAVAFTSTDESVTITTSDNGRTFDFSAAGGGSGDVTAAGQNNFSGSNFFGGDVTIRFGDLRAFNIIGTNWAIAEDGIAYLDGSGITNISGGSITSGTVADARLSSNVPLKNATNVFTAAQIFAGSNYFASPLVSDRVVTNASYNITRELLGSPNRVLLSEQTHVWNGSAFAAADNYGFGYQSGYQNNGASFTGIGYQSGYQNSGANFTGIGYQSGYQNNGASFTGIGYQSGRQNSGHNFTGIGLQSGYANSGANFTGIGNGSGNANTGANFTGIGYRSGFQNSGAQFTGIGYRSGYQNNWPDVVFVGAHSSTTFNADAATAKTFTDAEITANTITIAAGHGFGSSGKKNLLFTTTAGTPPTGLVSGTVYLFTITSSTVLTLSGIGVNASADFEGTLQNSVDVTGSILVGKDVLGSKANQVVLGPTNIVETVLQGTVLVRTNLTAEQTVSANYGFIRPGIFTTTSSFTLTATNDVVIATGGSGQTITFLTAAGITGKRYTIVAGHADGVALATTGGQTIQGTTPVNLTVGQSRTYFSDGANWWIENNP